MGEVVWLKQEKQLHKEHLPCNPTNTVTAVIQQDIDYKRKNTAGGKC